MTMSWLAERKATRVATSAVSTGAPAGSQTPTAAMVATSATWMQASQPRRWPNPRKAGGRSASSAGDQRNLLA